MNEQARTNADLIEEISILKQKNKELEQSESERKRAEEALLETQAILNAALDNSQAGIAIADAPSGALGYVNDAGSAPFGDTRSGGASQD